MPESKCSLIVCCIKIDVDTIFFFWKQKNTLKGLYWSQVIENTTREELENTTRKCLYHVSENAIRFHTSETVWMWPNLLLAMVEHSMFVLNALKGNTLYDGQQKFVIKIRKKCSFPIILFFF